MGTCQKKIKKLNDLVDEVNELKAKLLEKE
jgi:hypothetical protein